MNKKLLTILAVMVLIFTSCSKFKKVDNESFRLSGNMTNANKGYLVLLEMREQGVRVVDSIEIDKNGDFSITEKLPSPTLFILQGKNDYITICPQRKEDIKINANFEDMASTYKIAGSPESSKLQILNNEQTKSRLALKTMSDVMNMSSTDNFDSLKTVIRGRYMLLRNNQRKFMIDYINANLGSLTTLIALYRTMENEPLIDFHTDLDIYQKVLVGLEKKYPNNAHTLALKNFIEQAKQVQSQNVANESSQKK